MKIGTKANAIDDLGKFDGSKMTIKVNGKQIYPQKRYSIVRVDGSCPMNIEKQLDEIERDEMFSRCKDLTMNCKDCRYGDTKEQMILKVAQVLFEAKLEIYKNVYGIIPNDKFMKDIYAKQLKVAKKIIEFLGIK